MPILQERSQPSVSVVSPTSVQPTAQLRFDHLDCMLTDIGLWQHGEGCVPNPRHGYSIDDEARGLIVGLRYWQAGIEPRFHARLAQTCFQFIQEALILQGASVGRYHNFCDADGRWLDSVGSDDSFGRTLWGLGVAHAVDAPFAPRAAVDILLHRSLSAIHTLNPRFLRAKAFVILGLGAARIADGMVCALADTLLDAYDDKASDDWRWFEDGMTYCNARLPQALFIAARLFPQERRFARIGSITLDFLLEKTRNNRDSYSPVGNARLTNGYWFTRTDKTPPKFDQQPVDAGALVECCVEAWHTTGEPRFRQAAHDAFRWYLGSNDHGLPVYNPATGGVADALTRTGLNQNQGAESVLSIHLAHQALQTLELSHAHD